MINNTKQPLKKDRTTDELFEFTTRGHRLWLFPLVLLGLLLAAIYRAKERPADTPFIYTLF